MKVNPRPFTADTEKMDKPTLRKKLIRQGIISGAIFLAVVILSFIKTHTAETLLQRVEAAVSYTVDYKGAAIDLFNKIRTVVIKCF